MQSDAAWYIRGLPRLKQAFARVWDTEDLIVSMDAAIIWRPWWINKAWTPVSEGLHLDQNPFKKPDKDCIQGMVPLYDVTEESGGLEVCPRSHLDEAKLQFKTSYPFFKGTGHFLVLPGLDPHHGKAKLLLAKAGDLILWDSRLIHGGRVGTGPVERKAAPAVPDSHSSESSVPSSSGAQDPIEARVEAFLANCALSDSTPDAGPSSSSTSSSNEGASASATPSPLVLPSPPPPPSVQLVRLSQTVCMTPRRFASPEALKKRLRAVEDGLGCTHCPHEPNFHSLRSPQGYTPPVLSQEQRSLI